MKTVLCICTYRRPDGLKKLLDALPSLDESDALEVVVVDNDAECAGLAVCQNLPPHYPFKVHAMRQSEPGISAARNMATAQALILKPTLVAFLDDDEWPETQWLAELKRVQRQNNAAVVGGPTRPVFPKGTDAQLLKNPYYGADMGLPDGSACVLQAGGNFLIKAQALEPLAPVFFHPDFAHSGGEDLAFFMQLSQHGHTMYWANQAIVHEPVPESRLQDGWMRRRIINIHNSRVRVMTMLQPGLMPASIRLLKTVALGAVALVLSAIALLVPARSEQASQLRWKFQGKLSAHLGRSTVRSESY